MREKGAANLSTYTARLPYDDDDDDEVSISISVRPILMSDIGHRRIGGNFTHGKSRATALRFPMCLICSVGFTTSQ